MNTYTLPVKISQTIYAIGDIHGYRDSFHECLNWISKDPDPKTIVILGDVTDRGPDTRGCIQDILKLKERMKDDLVVLRGNHEILAQMAIIEDDLDYQECWIVNGGGNVVSEFPFNGNIEEFKTDITNEFKPFFDIVQNHWVLDDLVFVHAGLSRKWDNLDEALNQSWKIPLGLLNENDHWAWNRETAFSNTQESWWGKFIIHGHTPLQGVTANDIPHQINNWHLNLDYGSFIEGGFVNCARFQENRVTMFKEL